MPISQNPNLIVDNNAGDGSSSERQNVPISVFGPNPTLQVENVTGDARATNVVNTTSVGQANRVENIIGGGRITEVQTTTGTIPIISANGNSLYYEQFTNYITNNMIVQSNQPGGAPFDVQFQSSDGKFAGDPEFSYDPKNNVLSIKGIISSKIARADAFVTTAGVTLTPYSNTNLAAYLSSGLITTTGPLGIRIAGGTNGQVLTTDGSGFLSWTTVSGGGGPVNFANFAGVANSVAGANVSGVVANANYAAFSGIAGVANSVAGANVSGVVANANYAAFSGIASSANSVALANVVGAGNIASINLDGNVSNVLRGDGTWGGISASGSNFANFAGNVTVAAQPNITSVGTLTSLDVAGNVTLSSNANIIFTDGSVQTTAYPGTLVTTGVPPYRGFIASVNRFWGDDPSINQIVITNSPTVAYSNPSTNTDVDEFTATGLSGGNTVVMLNVYGDDNSAAIDVSKLLTVAQAFIDNVLYNGATLVTSAAVAKSNFYNNWNTIFSAVSGELFVDFDYITPAFFNNGYPSGGTGTNLRVFLSNGTTTYLPNGIGVPGSGYTVGDILTVLGSTYGGVDGINDATFVVTSVNGSGGVTGYTVSGTPAVANMPINSISDGGDDQYDDGNMIETDISGGPIPYFNGNVNSSGGQWGPASQYVTLYRSSTWAMVAFNTAVSSVNYSGGLGADGSGTKQIDPLFGTSSSTAINFANIIFDGTSIQWPDSTIQTTAWTGSVDGANVNGAVANANFANLSFSTYYVEVAAQPNITSVGTLTGLAVSGVSNLNAVGNVKITGGSNGQVLRTDGAGNLSWATVTGTPAGSDTQVQYNGLGAFAASSLFTYNPVSTTLSVVNLNASSGNVISKASFVQGGPGGFGGNKILRQTTDTVQTYIQPGDGGGGSTGNVVFNAYLSSSMTNSVTINTTNGSLTTTGNLNVGGISTFSNHALPSANITYDLGSTTQRWRSIYLSNNTIYLADAEISADANGGLTVNGDQVITSSGGVLDLGSNANVLLSGGTNGQVLTTDGTGNLSWTTVSGGGNTGNITFNGDEIGSTNNVVNILANDYAQLQSSENYLWVDSQGTHIESGEGNVWHFDTNGLMNFPGGAIVDSADNNFEVRGVNNVNFEAQSDINISAGDGASAWKFDGDGNFTLPGAVYDPSSPATIKNNYGFVLHPPHNTGGTGPELSIAYNDGIEITPVTNDYYAGGDTAAPLYISGAYINTAGKNPGPVVIQGGRNFATGAHAGISIITNNKTWSFAPSGNLSAPGNITAGGLEISGVSNLGPVENVIITGGTTGQTLVTDGSGSLSWADLSPAQQPIIEFVGSSGGGSGQSFNDANLASFASNAYASVTVNGVVQRVSDYTISGTTLTFPGYLAHDAEIGVGPLSGFSGSGGGGNVGDFIFSGTTMTVPTDDDMTVRAEDDLFLDALQDDVHIRADDDIRLRPGYDFANATYTWEYRFNSGTGEVSILNDAGPGTYGYIRPTDDGAAGLSFESVGNTYIKSGDGLRSWVFDSSGNLTLPSTSGGVIKTVANAAIGIAAIDGGTDNPAQLLSINANGTATTAISAYANSAYIQSNINGDIKTWAFDNTGNLILPGNTFAVKYANGTQVSLGGGSYGDSNVATLLSSFGSNSISTTGNVTANNFVGNVSITSNITGTGANVSLVAGSYTMTFDNTGVLTLPTVGGDEGGEINFGIPASNTTLTGPVKVDVFQDRIRFFDGSTKGAYIDLSQAATGVGTLLNNRVSGFVDAGTFITMDNIRATVTTSGQRGLSLATVTGSFTYNIGGTFAGAGVGSSGTSLAGQTLTTTPTSSIFGWGFTTAGDIAVYHITNTSSLLTYRITLQIGGSFNNNSIIIERLI